MEFAELLGRNGYAHGQAVAKNRAAVVRSVDEYLDSRDPVYLTDLAREVRTAFGGSMEAAEKYFRAAGFEGSAVRRAVVDDAVRKLYPDTRIFRFPDDGFRHRVLLYKDEANINQFLLAHTTVDPTGIVVVRK